jgi:transposase
MNCYPMAALERTMKIQEVILRALAKKITWWQAAEIIGITDRQMRRWHWRYKEYGYDGLLDRRLGKPSPKRVPLAVVEQVFGLYREKYFDLNVRHFHEKLGAEHPIRLSYSWVKKALQGAGLVSRERKRGVHRRKRGAPTATGDVVAHRREPASLVSGLRQTTVYSGRGEPTLLCNHFDLLTTDLIVSAESIIACGLPDRTKLSLGKTSCGYWS